MSGDDDEALTWAGGRDPSHYETPVAKAPKRQKAAAADAADGETAENPEDAAAVLPAVASGAALISLGIFVGIYALYTIGWFVSWQRFDYVAANRLDELGFSVQQALTIVAPAVWFASVVALTRHRGPAARLLWLLLGALILIPWSFALGR